MHLPSPNQQRLIFAGKNLRTHVSLSLCQQCLIFAGKQLKDVLKAARDTCLPLPDKQCLTCLVFTGKQLKDACLIPP
jgi:hypothetical protein